MFLLAFYVSIIVVGMISQIDIWLRFGALGRTAGAVESICCAMIYLKLFVVTSVTNITPIFRLKTKFCCNSVSATTVTASISVPRPPRSVQNK
ncbi:hypothetical protein AAVH_33808 [Aphelenchoides avenae]|nr:hypothetical protein AAVH_33808 [Aphelenchus avenae]